MQNNKVTRTLSSLSLAVLSLSAVVLAGCSKESDAPAATSGKDSSYYTGPMDAKSKPKPGTGGKSE